MATNKSITLNEQYIPRYFEEGLTGSFQCLGLHDDKEGLRVLLEHDSGRKVEIAFSGYTAYRNVNESFRLRTWRLGAAPVQHVLLIVDNSSWLGWLREESDGVLNDRQIMHYAIYTGEDCIDIATESQPVIRIS